jgi:hypothetical protein
MKGSKDGKAEGNKQQQQQQAGPALFPRLHVGETKQVGPKGPPRNKMALYEQFTIPSHRFRSSPMPLPSSTQHSINPSISPTSAAPVFPPQVLLFAAKSLKFAFLFFPCKNVHLLGEDASSPCTVLYGNCVSDRA